MALLGKPCMPARMTRHSSPHLVSTFKHSTSSFQMGLRLDGMLLLSCATSLPQLLPVLIVDPWMLLAPSAWPSPISPPPCLPRLSVSSLHWFQQLSTSIFILCYPFFLGP